MKLLYSGHVSLWNIKNRLLHFEADSVKQLYLRNYWFGYHKAKSNFINLGWSVTPHIRPGICPRAPVFGWY